MPAFTPPPQAPQRGDRATFSQRVDAFLTWMVSLVAQLNTYFASLTSLAAGGAASFAYSFDSNTADSDPGPGSLRLNTASQSTAQSIRLDNVTDDGVDITGYLTAFGSSTSTIKGSIRVQKVNDPSRWLLFDVTSVNSLGGYRNLTVQPRASSMASPFVMGDSLQIFFDRKGDKGEGGNTPTPEEMRAAIGTLPVENGGTGSTTASGARANLGLGNVNNTSDANKPVSTAQAQAFAARVSKIGDSMVGPLVFPNNVAIQMIDASGVTRNFAYCAGDNFVNFMNVGGMRTRWFNQAGNNEIFSFDNDGNTYCRTITLSSDERKKRNWVSLTEDQLKRLAKLQKVGIFEWVDGGGLSIGGSAQEIREIVPEAVYEDEDGNLMVNYIGLSFAMSQAALSKLYAD